MLALPSLIKSARVTCRAWTTADQPAMAAAIAFSIEHLRPWLPFVAAEPLSVDQRIALIEAMTDERDAGHAFHYGVFSSHAGLEVEPAVGTAASAPDPIGPVLGGVGLHRRSDSSLEIGYWIRADQVRQKLAAEVVRACIAAAFDQPETAHIALHHDRANAGSGGVARSCGFEFVAEGKRAMETPGETGVDWEWRMTREHWRWLQASAASTV